MGGFTVGSSKTANRPIKAPCEEKRDLSVLLSHDFVFVVKAVVRAEIMP